MPEPFLSMWSSSGAILNPSQTTQLLTLSLKPALCSVGDTDCWRPYSQIFIPVILLWSTLPWWDASLVDCNVNSLQVNLCGYKKTGRYVDAWADPHTDCLMMSLTSLGPKQILANSQTQKVWNLFKWEASHPSKETNFCYWCPPPHSFGHYQELMTIGEGRSIGQPVNQQVQF